MKYVFIYESRFGFRVTKMAKILEVKRSGYYKWVKAGNKTKSNIQDEYFLDVIKIEFKATTNSNHNYTVAENILNRNFTVASPCEA